MLLILLYDMDLHPLERKVLEGLKMVGGEGTAADVADIVGIQLIQAERFGYSLSQNGFISMEKIVSHKAELTDMGQYTLKNGLPEERLLKSLANGKAIINDAVKKAGIDQKAAGAALGLLKKNAWISTEKTAKGLELELTSLGKEQVGQPSEFGSALDEIGKGLKVERDLMERLAHRGLIKLGDSHEYILKFTKKFDESLLEGEQAEHQLTHKMLKTGDWKGTNFRKYDV